MSLIPKCNECGNAYDLCKCEPSPESGQPWPSGIEIHNRYCGENGQLCQAHQLLAEHPNWFGGRPESLPPVQPAGEKCPECDGEGGFDGTDGDICHDCNGTGKAENPRESKTGDSFYCCTGPKHAWNCWNVQHGYISRDRADDPPGAEQSAPVPLSAREDALTWLYHRNKPSCRLEEFGTYRVELNAYAIAEDLANYHAQASAGLRAERDRFKNDCLRWDAQYRDMEAERDEITRQRDEWQTTAHTLTRNCTTQFERAEKAESDNAALRTQLVEVEQQRDSLSIQLGKALPRLDSCAKKCLELHIEIAALRSKEGK